MHGIFWMSCNKDLISNIIFGELVIPGSHDSGTYGISHKRAASGMAICQSENIYEQLMIGIRYIDLRSGASNNSLENIYIYHGPIKSVKFFECINDVARFSKKYEEEIIIIKIQQENELTLQQANHLINYINVT